MKVACVIAALLFFLFTFWQFNDASQYRTADWGVVTWILTYSLAGLASLVTVFRPLPRSVYLVGLAGALVVAVYRLSAVQWLGRNIFYNKDNPAGNESGGLLIVAAWLAFLAWKAPRRPEPQSA